MPRENHRCTQLLDPGSGGFEIVDLEPQQYSIAMGEVWIADRSVVMLDAPSMELKNQAIVRRQPFVVGTPVTTLATQKALIPATAGLDVTDADQWLWSHGAPTESSVRNRGCKLGLAGSPPAGRHSWCRDSQ